MSKFKKLQTGEVLSESQFYKVEKIKGNRVQLSTESGQSIVVDSDYVDNMLNSATQFDEVRKVSRTKIAEIFIASSRVAMSVNFHKQVKTEDVAKGITALYDNLGIGMTKSDFSKQVKQALSLKGEERTMVGRHYGDVNEFGRVSFTDMEIERGKHNLRQVDPRTINYLIVDNVKYEVK